MWKILAIVGGIVVALIGSLFLVVYIGTMGFKTRPVTEAEKVLLAPFSEYYPGIAAELPLDTCESYSAMNFIDGSFEVEYSYDSDKDLESPFLYYVSGASIEPSEKSARETYVMVITGFKAGAAFAPGRKIIPVKDFLKLGEENYFARIEDDGEPIGNIVVTQTGSIVQNLLVLGITIDDRDELEMLLKPSVLAAKTWKQDNQ